MQVCAPAVDPSRRRARRAVVLAFAIAICGCSDGSLLQADRLTASGTTSTVVAPAPSTSAPPLAVTSTVTSTTVAPRRITMLFTGDTLPHDAVVASAREYGRASGVSYDFGPMWSLLRPRVEAADLAVCHLETTLTTDGSPPKSYPRFRAPTELAASLAAAGYDRCSTASNHAFDYGVDGVTQTIDALEQHGLGWSGTARTPEEASEPRVFDVGGVRVAHLSATYGLNGLRLPDGAPWLVTPLDVDALLAQAAAARAAGAEIVVVSAHCCAEYRVDPTAPQQEQFRALIQSPDVDLVIGHHAHVVQPIERVGDEYIVYGLGNILSNMYASTCCPAASQDGVVVETTFTEGPDGRFRVDEVLYTPTWVDRRGGHVVTPVADALREEQDPRRRAELEASWQRTVAAIESRGAAEHGVRPSSTP